MKHGNSEDSGGLGSALNLGAALLAGMYIVARAAANQFIPYSGEAAFAGLIAVLLALCISAKTFFGAKPARLPNAFVYSVVLWAAVYLWGALRSPNLGVAVPLAADAGMYLLLLLSGYLFAVNSSSGLVDLFARAMVAMVSVEALAGIWQRYIDLPWLQQEVQQGREILPETLQTTMGVLRLNGTDVFGTFGNPNSLAAYLVAGIWLLAGLCWENKGARRLAGFLLALPLFWALLLTHSKGGLAACAMGAWFFAAQRIAHASPRFKRPLVAITAFGIGLMFALLALGYFEKIDLGASLIERFGYWKAAFAMVAAHPLEGVGLGGFAENYPFFKIALGRETREAHNDYLHLFAELGILGPLIYLALWALLLRVKISSRATSTEAEPVAKLESAMLAGGVLAFALIYLAFQSFNSVELFRIFSGQLGTHGISAVIESFALPVVFVGVVVFLRRVSNASGSRQTALWHGVRAAVGAVLVHEVVDFDFRAQALIGGLLFLAGMMYAATDAAQSELEMSPAPQRLRTRLLLPALALALFPFAVWIPLASGLPRVTADSRADEARDLSHEKSVDPDDPKASAESLKEYRALLRDSADLRKDAAQAAPFDANAWIDLANALESLQAADRSQPQKEGIFNALKKAERLRPLASYPKIVLGDFYFRNAMRAQRRGLARDDEFDAAQKYYRAGAARYPFSPGPRLLSGDALLMSGRVKEAASEYHAALQIDAQILDINIRLSGIFTDGHSAAIPRHGCDGDIVIELNHRLSELPVPQNAAEARVHSGLQLRRLFAFAALIHQSRRSGALKAQMLQKLQAEMTLAAEQLVAAQTEFPERAHAALLAAVSFELAEDKAGKSAAWPRAVQLQNESISAGKLGTPKWLFDYYAQALGGIKP